MPGSDVPAPTSMTAGFITAALIRSSINADNWSQSQPESNSLNKSLIFFAEPCEDNRTQTLIAPKFRFLKGPEVPVFGL